MSTEHFVQFGESAVQQSKRNNTSSQAQGVTDAHGAREREPSEHEPVSQSTCTECEGQIITPEHTSYCEECGLVITAEHIDHGPTRRRHGPDERSGSAEWSCESVTQLRIDKGLHTTFFLTSDGYGNALSSAQRDKYDRLKQRHKRFQVASKRAIRLNEAPRDVQLIGDNLGLPHHVVVDAGQLVKRAGEAGVPGAWTSWEGLAAGAVLLVATDAGLDRPSREVACYGKVSHVRLCAAARKIRCHVSLDLPPVRTDTVARVLETLDKNSIDSGVYLRLRDVAQHVMEIADEVPIGAGTPRLTVAAAAVYAADRLLGSECFTMQQVADAISVIVETSKDKINRYSSTLRTEYAEREEAATPPSQVYDDLPAHAWDASPARGDGSADRDRAESDDYASTSAAEPGGEAWESGSTPPLKFVTAYECEICGGLQEMEMSVKVCTYVADCPVCTTVDARFTAIEIPTLLSENSHSD